MIQTLIVRLLLALERRLRPGEGWGVFTAVSVALAALALAVEESAWMRRAPGLFWPALLAVWAGAILARQARRRWHGAVLAALAGAVVVPLSAAAAWPPLSLLLANLRSLAIVLQGARQPPGIVPLGAWVGERLGRWAGDLAAWAGALAAGRPAPDTAPLVLLILLAIWAAGAWAGWITFRRRRALLALTPAGALLATNVFFSQSLGGEPWLLIFMGALLSLAIFLRHATLRSQWEAGGVDYSPELRLELYAYGFMTALIILTAMPLLPNWRLRPLSRAFWRLVDAPYTALEEGVQTLFPDLDRPPRSLLESGPLGGGGLPRAHLLGGGPELGEQVVMYVRTSDARPGDPAVAANYRWRGLTFSSYNGRGWDPPDVEDVVRLAAGEVWSPQSPEGRRPLRQVFEFVGSRPYWLYAAAEPVSADRSYRAHLRGPGDLVGLDVRAGDYIVISQIPDLSAGELRALSSLIPAQIEATYLALPPSLPERVPALAREVAGDAATPFDQAVALESYLRGFPYNLDVPAPPPGVDVADYFLFDLQQGYCDYYAAAMVVMARSLGLPARLAVGYASGVYDGERGRFTVTEADAHSWPELYFPGAGWIPFEPTAAQPRFTHEAGSAQPAPAGPPATLDLAAELSNLRLRGWLVNGLLRWSAPLLGLLLLLGAGRWLWGEWRLRRRAANPWQLAYLRLEGWGRRLGVAPADWYTPREYVAAWRQALNAAGAEAQDAQAALGEIERLGRGLEAQAYAPATRRPAGARARRIWRRLRPWLWRRRLARWRSPLPEA